MRAATPPPLAKTPLALTGYSNRPVTKLLALGRAAARPAARVLTGAAARVVAGGRDRRGHAPLAPQALTLLAALLLAACALASPALRAQTYGADDQALTFFDAFCCQAGDTPIDQHTPEIGPAWTVEGTTDDALKPKITTSRANFEPGSPAVAVAEGPEGERTLHALTLSPTVYPADVTLYLFERYQDAQNYTAVRVRWPVGSDDTHLAIVSASGGAVQTTPLGSATGSQYATHVPITVHSVPAASGHTLTVTAGAVTFPPTHAPGLVGESRFALAADTPAHPNGGYHARIADLTLTRPQAPVGIVCEGLNGWNAESCVRREYAALRTYLYDDARDYLFRDVWVDHVVDDGYDVTRYVSGIYGGLVRSWRQRSPFSPREQVQNLDFNTEHVWPRSRGAQTHPSTDGAAHNDLHHLAPAYGPFNSARSNRAFGDDFDPSTDTQKWIRNATTRHASSGPPSDPATWSRVERDFLQRPDDGDGRKDLSELGRFDVRHAMRGDVARMAAYFLVTYRIEAEDGDEGRAFIDATLDVLLDWHEQDPVDDAERERNERVYRIQGNRNPFVLDPTLMRRAFYQGPNQPRPRDLWINEIHHSNDGADRNEGVEIAGRAGTDLYGYRVWVYSGYGYLYQVDGDGTDNSPAIAFRGTIDDEGGGLGAVWQGAKGLRGGCQGLALTDPDGALLQFLSYGGCRFNATAGPVWDAAERYASGAGHPAHPDSLAWSTAVRGPRQAGGTHRRVQQWSELPPGHTLQLTGAGSDYADFDWTGPLPHTRGRLGDYQAPGALRSGAPVANAVTGWASGDPIPLGLLAPAVDTGHDEDAPQPPPEAPLAPEAESLTVSPPGPNPARSATRLTVAAPPGTRVHATVYDALGRAVAQRDDVTGDLRLDVSRLASGVYTVRVHTGGAHTGGAEAVTHRLTVVR